MFLKDILNSLWYNKKKEFKEYYQNKKLKYLVIINSPKQQDSKNHEVSNVVYQISSLEADCNVIFFTN